jgi:Tol biopolymer transport system component
MVALVLAGCGRLHFADLVDRDAAGDTTDSGVAVDCWAGWRAHTVVVQPPRLVDELVTGQPHGDPSLSADGLTLYYTLATASSDLLLAARPGLTDRWTPVGPISELNTTSAESKLSVSADGLTGVFTSNRASTDTELFLTSRTSATATWAAPSRQLLSPVNTPGDDFDPFLTGDGLRVYFAPDPGTGQHIRTAVRPDVASAFALDRDVVELAMTTTYSDPTLSPDQLVIAYAANPMAMLFYATRTSTTVPFGTPVAVPSVNGGGRQTDVELSRDGCEIYFGSTRSGQKEVYVSVVTP